MKKVQRDLHQACLEKPFKPYFKIAADVDGSTFASWSMVKKAYGDYATYSRKPKRKRDVDDAGEEGEDEGGVLAAAKKARVAKE